MLNFSLKLAIYSTLALNFVFMKIHRTLSALLSTVHLNDLPELEDK